jgi:hypothetical protein
VFNRAAILALLIIDVAAVVALMRILSADPAPAFFGGSLQRAATRMLRPAGRKARYKRAATSTLGAAWARRWWIAPFAATGMLAWRVPVSWGPLGDATESTEYLDALWVVVAASLGLSVAMVAFAFQAFMDSGRKIHGGTLQDFAEETRLLDAIRLGVLTLVVIGVVRLHIGHDSPAGWAAAWAIILSAATLTAVPYVVSRVVRSLDESGLLKMRERRLARTVKRAMLHQLTEQAAEAVLKNTPMPVARAYIPPPHTVRIESDATGEVCDIKLARLSRALQRDSGGSARARCDLAVSLGTRVDIDEPLMWIAGTNHRPAARRLRRAVKIRVPSGTRPDRALLDQLGQLHTQALEAAKQGLTDRWRQISESYEQVLLALPPAAASFNVQFTGQIAAPGFFGRGPLQSIRDHLFDELEVAVKYDNPDVVDAISYFPARIADRAVRIGAPAIATTMLSLYTSMYFLAERYSQ